MLFKLDHLSIKYYWTKWILLRIWYRDPTALIKQPEKLIFIFSLLLLYLGIKSSADNILFWDEPGAILVLQVLFQSFKIERFHSGTGTTLHTGKLLQDIGSGFYKKTLLVKSCFKDCSLQLGWNFKFWLLILARCSHGLTLNSPISEWLSKNRQKVWLSDLSVQYSHAIKYQTCFQTV